MSELFDAIWTVVVSVAELALLWAVMSYVAPGLATALLWVVLTVGLVCGVIGGVIGFITS